jgi:hypothetical protein
MRLPEPVVEHLAAHHAVVSRRELLRDLGCRTGQIRGWINRRLLDRHLAGVYTAPGVH